MANESLKDILREIFEGSTFHGIPSILKTRTIFMKIIWTFFSILATALCLQQIIYAILNFQNYDTITSIATIVEMPTFPTITICNLNPFQTDIALQSLNRSSNTSGFDDFEILLFNLNQMFLYNDTTKRSFSYNMNETLIDCRFNAKKCNSDEFDWYFDPLYGNCYRYNSKNPLKKIIQPGNRFGLRLELFAGDSNRIPAFIKNFGFQVMINNQTVLPSLNEGFTISTGIETNLKVSRMFAEQLGDPYNHCILNSVAENMYNLKYYKRIIDSNRTYRQKDCYAMCAQNEIIKSCSCFFILFEKFSSVKQCLSPDDFKCALDFMLVTFRSEVESLCSKYCPLECNSVLFTTTATFAGFPNFNYAKTLMTQNTKISSKLDKNISIKDMTQSVLALNIYYDELSYVYYSEQPKSETVDLISTLGGLFGLFIGGSFLSFVEFIEIILEIFCSLCFKCTNKVQKNQVQSE